MSCSGVDLDGLDHLVSCEGAGAEEEEEDPFEKEMEEELERRIKRAEEEGGIEQAEKGAQEKGKSEARGAAGEKYDDIYFDSDDDDEAEEEGKAKKRARERSVLSNDDLLYDPDEDDENQKYVDGIREEYRSVANRRRSDIQWKPNNAASNFLQKSNVPFWRPLLGQVFQAAVQRRRSQLPWLLPPPLPGLPEARAVRGPVQGHVRRQLLRPHGREAQDPPDQVGQEEGRRQG